jgi:hypothetical protein
VSFIPIDPVKQAHNLSVSSTDEVVKTAAYLSDNLLDPKTAASQEVTDGPLSRAFGPETWFEFLEKPDNAYRLRRYGVAIHGLGSTVSLGAIMAGDAFPFGRLK